MENGTISQWMKQEGDEVATGDVLCEVETDKATMDYESVQEGTLLKILVDEGDSAAVEQPIGIIGEKDEEIDDLVQEAEQELKQQKEGGPSAGESEQEAAPPPSAGSEGAAKRAPENDAAPKKAPAVQETPKRAPAAEETDSGERIKSSPLARRIAEKYGISLTAVKGSGPEGRVVKKDVEKAIQKQQATARPATEGTAPAAVTGREQRTSISRKRRVIAERLSQSKFTAPHYYLRTGVDIGPILAFRKKYNAKAENKLSLNGFFLKLAAEALKRHPHVNASWQEDAIVTFGSIDIGLAVAQKDGLITPVVRNCGEKGVRAIDAELKDLIERARNNKLSPDEYTGATFSISNLGNAGIEEFTAIINPPGSAILALGSAQKVPKVDENDQIIIKQIMYMTLSCDHRVIDGAVGAAFLHDLQEIIEEPIKTLL